MKNKKRLLKIVTIVLLFSTIVRFGNICLLTLGDYSKKNVYALSNTGAWVWWFMGDAADYEVDGDGAASVQFEGEYEISRESGGKWDALGMFGIHNVTDKEEGMLFYIRDYTCFRHIDENYISFIYINGKKNNYAEFHVEDGQIILSDDRYKEAMEEHAGSLDEIVQKAEEVLKSYKSVMNVFTIMAITFV